MSSSEVKAHREEWLYELSELPALLTVCLRSCRKIKKKEVEDGGRVEGDLMLHSCSISMWLAGAKEERSVQTMCFRVINIPEKQ